MKNFNVVIAKNSLDVNCPIKSANSFCLNFQNLEIGRLLIYCKTFNSNTFTIESFNKKLTEKQRNFVTNCINQIVTIEIEKTILGSKIISIYKNYKEDIFLRCENNFHELIELDMSNYITYKNGLNFYELTAYVDGAQQTKEKTSQVIKELKDQNMKGFEYMVSDNIVGINEDIYYFSSDY